jgi:hypothetical protein
MIGAALFSLLPTALAYVLLCRTGLVRTGLLRFAFACFLGQYVSAWVVFCLALALTGFTSQPLLKASIVAIDVVVLALILWYRQNRVLSLPRSWAAVPIHRLFSPDIAIGVASLAFAYLLFIPHLQQREQGIFRSSVYWDFSIHYPIIQTFVHGDNFPPENESFAGVPMTYHFFFDFLTAIYSTFGLGLVGAMQFVSILSMAVMLLAVAGLGSEWFGSRAVGVLAGLLCVTSSSLRFISPPLVGGKPDWSEPATVFLALARNTIDPYVAGFVPGNPFAYNGNMWNVFYFIAERQMIVGILFLLFCGWLLSVVERIPRPAAFWLGILMGLFLQWHFYISIMVVAAVIWTAMLRPSARRPLLYLLVGYLPVFLGQAVYLKSLLNDAWFLPEIHQYPRLSFDFPTMREYPFSLQNAFGYYVYGYGLKLVFLVLALFLMTRERLPALTVVTGIVVPTFVLISTIQVSPLSIYDNHKWLRPMNVVIDIAVAYALVRMFSRLHRRALTMAAGAPILLLLTASGLMELMPFLNTEPRSMYSDYPNRAIRPIRQNSEPRATFLSAESRDLHLAGRKVYLGNPHDEPGATSLVVTEKLNYPARQEAIMQIYASESAAEFCGLIGEHRIDVVEFGPAARLLPLFPQLEGYPRFETVNRRGERILWINARSGCRPS